MRILLAPQVELGGIKNVKRPSVETTLVSVLVVLLVSGLAAVGYSLVDPQFNPASAVSGWATYAVALLTVAYVLTTRSQLRVMTHQLAEMRRDRELQSQPLPWPIEVTMESDPPDIFWNPRDGSHNPLVRHHACVTIKNFGQSPAVSVDVCVRLVLSAEKPGVVWTAASSRIEVLEADGQHPAEGESMPFLFPEDKDGQLLERELEGGIATLPLLEVEAYYRNILGACFRVRRTYRLYTSEETQAVLTAWLERLRVFPLRHKSQLARLGELSRREDSRADVLDDEMRSELANGLVDVPARYDVWAIPATGEIHPISPEEYEMHVSDLYYMVMLQPTNEDEPET